MSRDRTRDARARLAGLAVLVVGVGRTGRAAAAALVAADADVRAVDAGDGEAVQEAAAALDAAGVLVRIATPLGRASLVDGVDLVVASPGVPPSTGVLRAAVDRGIPVISEPELAWELAGGRTRLVGVTGTNGKTTTAEVLARLLGAPAAGNIGTPLVEVLAAAEPPPLVVAELSSFQLHFAVSLRCDVGALLNVADDHLDWHGSRAAYAAAKARVWAGQRPTGAPGLAGADWAVVGADDAGAVAALTAHRPGGRVFAASAGPLAGADAAAAASGHVGVDAGALVLRLAPEVAEAAGAPSGPVEVARVDEIGLRGPHNLANVSAAVAAAVASAADPAVVADPRRLAAPLAEVRPGAHRLAVVAESAGVRWVDDSKATNPHAAAAALASFDRVVWIAGGLAKGVDMAALDPVVARHARAVVTIGTDGPLIAERARRLGVPTTEAGELARAVAVAAELAEPGDVVLLAPACASMDQFRDYAERGDRFAALARASAAPAAERAGAAPDQLRSRETTS